MLGVAGKTVMTRNARGKFWPLYWRSNYYIVLIA